MRHVLGIDIGGTNMRGALVDAEGNISERKNIKSDARAGIGDLIENLAGFIDFFGNHNPSAVGIGIPGIIDQKNGNLTQAPNISDVSNYPIINVLEERLPGIQFIVDNDANSAAAGEFWKGSCVDSGSMVMLTIGTGLGGGIVLNGELWHGEDGMAGEIGHMVIDPDGPVCNCGNRGCLESFVSAEAIRRVVKSSSSLTKQTRETEVDHIPEKLMQLASDGDKESIEVWSEFGKHLGIGITSLINLLNVDSVVIGGGLSNAWDLFIEKTLEEIEQRALTGPKTGLKILRAKLGDDAGIVGSAYLAFKKLELINQL